jgi:hypothetical protein
MDVVKVVERAKNPGRERLSKSASSAAANLAIKAGAWEGKVAAGGTA